MLLVPATLSVLLQAFVAVFVVDLAGLGVGKGFISLCDFDELLLRSLVATNICQTLEGSRKIELQIKCQATYGFLSGWNFLLRDRYARLMSLVDACLSMPKSYKL